MFVYFVKWSMYADGQLKSVGQLEMKRNNFISSIEDINDICNTIRKKIFYYMGDEITVTIDFYNLLRRETE